MARLLVTGGAGFIGSNFVHHRLRTRPTDTVVVLDALTYAGNLASLRSASANPNFQFVRGNICDYGLILELLRGQRIDTIVHFAAESHVDRSIAGPDAFIETNIVGTHALLKAAREAWLQDTHVRAHRFHHISTDEVYGSLGPSDPPFTERTPYAPNSPYSASKAAADHLVRAYNHTYGLQVTISNCSNNYGPFHFPEKLIPLVIVNLLHGKPLPVYGDGRQVRDWLYVEDHCRAIDLILSHGRVGAVYNVGGNCEYANIDLVRALCGLTHQLFADDSGLRARFPQCPAAQDRPSENLIRFVQDRPGHDRRYAIDAALIARDCGFTPSVSLHEGLRRTFEWYLENESWWSAILGGKYREWVDTHYERLSND